MIVYIVTETWEKYQERSYTRPKTVLEEAADDVCLVLHYRQAAPALLRRLRPVAIVHSGTSTPFEDYDIRRTSGYRRTVTECRIPQLGICGGHQLIAFFFGGRVSAMRRVRGDEADLNPRYHPREFKEWGMYPVQIVRRDPIFSGLPDTIRVQQFHRSEVKRLGRELLALAQTPDCAVQAFVHRSRLLYGVQFHPEEATDEYPDGRILLRNFFRLARRAARAG
jgi:GMP synthase (glutamine-hydrolysing)